MQRKWYGVRRELTLLKLDCRWRVHRWLRSLGESWHAHSWRLDAIMERLYP